MNRIYTAGNVEVQNIKIGDIHYEYEYGICLESKVITMPVSYEENGETYWTWESESVQSKEIIKYVICEKYSHYGPKLYNYKAYYHHGKN